jgi:hypothetical protein
MTTHFLKLRAIADLCKRYGATFRSAWAIRDQLDTPDRTAQELQFLPANLELVETPSHPAPRWTMRVIVALGVLILLMVVFGKLDIVATAKGKLIPGERVKTVQPAITGVVRQILIRDGERVTQGQALLVLAPHELTPPYRQNVHGLCWPRSKRGEALHLRWWMALRKRSRKKRNASLKDCIGNMLTGSPYPVPSF